MWTRICYSVFIFLFTINDAFATQKAIKAAREHFTEETYTTWFFIASTIIVIAMMGWLLNNNRKNAEKKKKLYTERLKNRFSK